MSKPRSCSLQGQLGGFRSTVVENIQHEAISIERPFQVNEFHINLPLFQTLLPFLKILKGPVHQSLLLLEIFRTGIREIQT